MTLTSILFTSKHCWTAEADAIYIRMVETLALAIEASDSETHDHVRRVQHYAELVGQRIELPASEQKALSAAALLHDIGKLAVPDCILRKPGLLTAEEFEKVKLHPVIGAEILDKIEFPYPVVPIVLAHHEKWDGSGYPYGLRGTEIPMGARIIAVVDCLDALTSDRPYRPAKSFDEAMSIISGEANRSFDSEVVAVLQECCQEMKLSAPPDRGSRLSKNLRIRRGVPGAGLDVGDPQMSLVRVED